MWVYLIILVITIILTIVLMPNPKFENARANSLSDVKFPTAAAGAPVPLILGTVRLNGPNTIFLGDFAVKEVTKQVGGSIFSSSKTQTIAFDYYLGLQLGLCVGGGVKLRSIWFGKDLLWTGNSRPEAGLRGAVYTTNNHDVGQFEPTYTQIVPGSAAVSGLAKYGPEAIGPMVPSFADPVTGAPDSFYISQANLLGGPSKQGGYSGMIKFYGGYDNQPQDQYLKDVCDSNVPSYAGICYIIFEKFNWAHSTNLPQVNFELQRITNSLGLPAGTNVTSNGWDLNPMEVLYQLLVTNPYCMNLPVGLLNIPSFLAAGAILAAEDFGISVLIDSSNPAKSVIDEILRACNAVLYQDSSTGQLTVVLIRHETDLANLSQVPTLDESIVIQMKNYTIQTWSETINQMRVKFNDRNTYAYGSNAVAAQDFGNYGFQGRILSSEISMPVVYDLLVANQIAARELAYQSVPIYKCQLVCNRKASVLHPGMVFKLNWPAYGFSQQIFRVQKMQLGTLADGKITIDAIQEEFAVANTVFSVPIQVQTNSPSRYPQPVVSYYYEETPRLIQVLNNITVVPGLGYIQAFATPPSGNSVDFYVQFSKDNFVTNGDGLTAVSYSSGGTLFTDYNMLSDANYDSSLNLVVANFVNPNSFIYGPSDSDLRNGANLLLIDGEYFNFSTFSINDNKTATFTNIRRGLLDTQPVPHFSGARVWVVSPTYNFDHSLPSNNSLSLKFLDDNGAYVYPAANAVTLPITLSSRADRPLPPSYILVDGRRNDGVTVINSLVVVLSWAERLRTKTTLSWANDPTETPEAGTSYIIGISKDNANWTEVFSATNTKSINPTPGTNYIRVQSVLNGLRSWSYPTIVIQVQGNIVATRLGENLLDRTGAQITWR